jgi:hypothetical protein
MRRILDVGHCLEILLPVNFFFIISLGTWVFCELPARVRRLFQETNLVKAGTNSKQQILQFHIIGEVLLINLKVIKRKKCVLCNLKVGTWIIIFKYLHLLLQVMSEYDQAQAIEEVTGFAPR